MLTQEEFTNRYVHLITEIGLGLQRGQKLYIITSYTHYPFARKIAEKAYAIGVSYVHIELLDKWLLRARIEHATGQEYTYYPQFLKEILQECVDQRWAFLRLGETDELRILDGADKDKLTKMLLAKRAIDKIRLEASASDRIPWSIVEYPSLTWASEVFGGMEASQAMSLLQEALERVLRLEQPDPIEAWKAHLSVLQQRAELLNSWKLHKLFIKNSSSDFQVELLPNSLWKSGASVAEQGTSFVANLPTEEVFTAPDYRKTQGKVKTVRPVTLFNKQIQEVEFFFQEGRVVAFQASNDADLVKKFLDTDRGSLSLGEIALVDVRSPLYQEKRSFSSILYDENASCHFALGNAYPTCLLGGRDLHSQALLDAGLNVSLNHTDFMFGDHLTNITGVGFDGKEYSVLEQGEFQLKVIQ